MPAGATYEPIATASINGVSTYTFSGISSSYTDLKLITNAIVGSSGDYLRIRFNGDTATNYSSTGLRGNGSAATSSRFTSQTGIYLGTAKGGSTTIPLLAVVNVFSYGGSTNKTCLIEYSNDQNGDGSVERHVGLWRSTSAITSLTVYSDGAINFASGSTATLYGIKAA